MGSCNKIIFYALSRLSWQVGKFASLTLRICEMDVFKGEQEYRLAEWQFRLERNSADSSQIPIKRGYICLHGIARVRKGVDWECGHVDQLGANFIMARTLWLCLTLCKPVLCRLVHTGRGCDWPLFMTSFTTWGKPRRNRNSIFLPICRSRAMKRLGIIRRSFFASLWTRNPYRFQKVFYLFDLVSDCFGFLGLTRQTFVEPLTTYRVHSSKCSWNFSVLLHGLFQ